jgi:hypothetical protein
MTTLTKAVTATTVYNAIIARAMKQKIATRGHCER